MKIVKSREEYGLLIKHISETIQNKAKEQKGGFLWMLLGTLWASLLENLWTGKSTIRASGDTELARIFNAASSLNKFWNTSIIKMNLNLRVFIQ